MKACCCGVIQTTLLSAVFLFMISGCGPLHYVSYKGAPRQIEEVCFVKCPYPWGDHGTFTDVEAVDGISLPAYEIIELLPGEHTFEVSFVHYYGEGTRLQSRSPEVFRKVFQAGRVYEYGVRTSEFAGAPLWSLTWTDATSKYQRSILDRIGKKRQALLLQESGQNPQLVEAARYGDMERVKLLIQKGAYVDVKTTTDAITPLWAASYEGHTEVVKLLLEKGADVNAKDIYSETVLWIASYKGHTDIVKLLLDRGADIEIKRTSDGVTALWQASWRGHIEIVRLLLDKGADVNVKRTTNGATDLWVASYEGHTEVVKLLLEKGADVNATNNAGLTPLDTAEERGHTDIVRLLKERGAKSNRKVPTMN